ncbi:hypothetical protein ACFQWB_04885 [Paenibacillus thermoaerophilus]|uniref:Uncharacterized protein n=1 Tax=Paenibacillus thermoaerophilus TaxID=1215385 RepID=A0ABW2V4T5_9BACL|nr:hypothetical protein [Paenibacillus thermoaerophilus]TMV14395.1 hypothetical protein FE781_10765 [Paenibacillus thermoaerophilus]
MSSRSGYADALTVEAGRLQGPAPDQTQDMRLALQSLARLSAYDINTVICYHGGVYRAGDVNRRIAEIAGS